MRRFAASVLKIVLVLAFLVQVAFYLEAITCLLMGASQGSASGLGVAALLYYAAGIVGDWNRALSQFLRRAFKD